MTQYLTPKEAQDLGVTAAADLAVAAGETPSPRPPAPSPLPCFPGWQRITADTLLCRGPALLYGAVLTSDGVGTADVILYDGPNTSGRRLFQLLAPTTQSVPVILPAPVPLEDGLYIDVGSNVGDLFILYAPLPG
jgi:hypothetical protein